MEHVRAPVQGTVVSIDVREGETVRAGQQLFVLESMKIEHVVTADTGGVIASVPVAVGQTVMPGDALATMDAREAGVMEDAETETSVDVEHVRADLGEVLERHDVGLDHRRPDAVARR